MSAAIQHTIYKDHTGRWIREGDKCEMCAGHAHCDDWKGSILLIDNVLTFRHDEPELGDVPVSECFGILEVLPQAQH